MFQSTHPHGCDWLHLSDGNSDAVSIMHPHGCDPPVLLRIFAARFNPRTGRGSNGKNFSQSLMLFQSTHPHGVRRGNYETQAEAFPFQSTHPHGVRLFSANFLIHSKSFQSTHPHGVRHATVSDVAMTIPVSIHAPARGATRREVKMAKIKLFQLLPHGCDRVTLRCLAVRPFQPRTRTGCD